MKLLRLHGNATVAIDLLGWRPYYVFLAYGLDPVDSWMYIRAIRRNALKSHVHLLPDISINLLVSDCTK